MGPLLLSAISVFTMQATQARVVGTVRDERTGEPLAGAVVMLTDLNRTTITDSGGRYALRQVPAGPQHITVRFIGYAPRTLHALVPLDGPLEINVALQPVPFQLASINVSPSVAIRGVDHGDHAVFPDRGASMAAIANHPLLAEPDVFQALGGGEVVMKPESPSGIHVRGGDADHTAYLLDGIPVFSPYHAAGLFSAWNPDALAELQLSASAPPPSYHDALSGAVSAITRAPGARLGARGSIGTTQARLTFDGPLGRQGAGFVVSTRSGFPAAFAPRSDPAFQRGETGDWLAKLEAPALGGRVRFLGYDNDNELTTGVSTADSAAGPQPRNAFQWHSRSLGAGWSRDVGRNVVRVLAWSAMSDAGASWAARSGRVDLTAARRDEGLLASVDFHNAATQTTLGLRVERSRTAYRIAADSAAAPTFNANARTPVAALFAQHARPIGRRVDLELGAALAQATGRPWFAPRARLQWRSSPTLTLSGSFARLYQFAQSLRNAESVVGVVFPVDLYLGAGARGVPVARSDQGVLGADFRPSAGVRLGAQMYQRRFSGLLLVAPRNGDPFTTQAFTVGSGDARGLSLDAAVGAARYGIVASYGLQRVRRRYGDASYVPDHGATHLIEGGVIIFPAATFSMRVGATGAMGRRTSIVSGDLEFESCNLVDRGCEFIGSPYYSGDSLGARALPPYVRLDIGFRKHWHIAFGNRDAMVALFGTISNVFNRTNILTYARDPSTGQLGGIDLRPRAPLVVGLDWQF